MLRAGVGCRRWPGAGAAVGAARPLGEAREEIDALNVFPVPDGDTGTNLYLTLEAAVTAAQQVDRGRRSRRARRRLRPRGAARGPGQLRRHRRPAAARLGRRARASRGQLDAVRGSGGFPARRRAGLDGGGRPGRGHHPRRSAGPPPVPPRPRPADRLGEVVGAAAAAAAGGARAHRRAAGGAAPGPASSTPAGAGWWSCSRRSRPRAGVVRAPRRPARPRRRAGCPLPTLAASTAPPEPQDGPGVRGDVPAGRRRTTPVAALRAQLAGAGGLAGRRRRRRAVERARARRRPGRRGRGRHRRPATRTGSGSPTWRRARASTAASRHRRAGRRCACAAGPGLAALFAQAGAVVVASRPGRRPTRAGLLDAVRRTAARQAVAVLPNDGGHARGGRRPRPRWPASEGIRVTVLPTRAAGAGPGRGRGARPGPRLRRRRVAMSAAAAGARHGAVTVATEEALPAPAGAVRRRARRRRRRLRRRRRRPGAGRASRSSSGCWRSGGELVTLVVGADGRAGPGRRRQRRTCAAPGATWRSRCWTAASRATRC